MNSRPYAWKYVNLFLADIRDVNDLNVDDGVKWTWIMLLQDARIHDGKIPKENLRKRLGITPKTAEKRIEIFEKNGLILDRGDHWEPRHWKEEQSAPKPKRSEISDTSPKTGAERSRAFRERQRETRNANENANATREVEGEVDQGINSLMSAPPPRPKRSPPRRSMAEDEQPDDRQKHDATEVGLSIPEFRAEWSSFRDHHRSKGSVMADWPAAWRQWLRNRGRFALRNNPSPGGGKEDNFIKAAKKLLGEIDSPTDQVVRGAGDAYLPYESKPYEILDLEPLRPRERDWQLAA